MSGEQTTVIVQRYLDALAAGTPAEPVVRALLDRAAWGKLWAGVDSLLKSAAEKK
jgi:hypothetical protein